MVDDFSVLISKGNIYIAPQHFISIPSNPIATGTNVDGTMKFDDLPQDKKARAFASSVRFRNKVTHVTLRWTFNHQNDVVLARLLKPWPVLSNMIRVITRGKSSCDPCHESKVFAIPQETVPSTSDEPFRKVSADTTGPVLKSVPVTDILRSWSTNALSTIRPSLQRLNLV